MPSRAERGAVLALICLICLIVSACAGPDRSRPGRAGGYRPVSDAPVRIGPPYSVRGITYTPRAQRGYDEAGIASWYGSESGNRTANGERFRPNYITAAHRTLPLPSYVEVTALDSGRTILVRINDRGPFVAGRIIDLSKGSAEALGIRRAGAARVRVRQVDPSERDRAALRSGRMAAARQGFAGQQPTPVVVSRPVPVPPALPRPAPWPAAAPPSPWPTAGTTAGTILPRLQLDLPPPEPETEMPGPPPDPPVAPDAASGASPD